VQLETPRSFTFPSETNFRGSISAQHNQLLQAILDEPSVRLQVTCTLNEQSAGAQKSSKILPQTIPCSLSITLYGPINLFEELGTFFQDYDIYLQDPSGCDLDVRYYNPHRLSAVDLASCPMTSTLDSARNLLEAFDLQAVPRQSDLLAILDAHEDLPEASQPYAIQTPLER
jgi:hypothetical protein